MGCLEEQLGKLVTGMRILTGDCLDGNKSAFYADDLFPLSHGESKLCSMEALWPQEEESRAGSPAPTPRSGYRSETTEEYSF